MGIPINSSPSVVTMDYESILLAGKYNLCPVGSPKSTMDLIGEIHFDGYELIKDSGCILNGSTLLGSSCKLDSIGHIRSQRIAQLKVQPFQYNPVTGELLYFSHITLR